MAVIGVGHLGKEHARILAGLPDVKLVGVTDVNVEQAQLVADRCGTTAFAEITQLFDQVDAVTVVVPTVHHHLVASEFLKRGIPVLVEKPIATTVAQADDLVRLATENKVPLQVGHIERFNPAFEELIRRPIRPKFIESERHGPFTGRSTDIGVVLDLMIHDIDLLLSLTRSTVKHVEALGLAVFGGHEDIVNARLIFENGCVAHVTASRVSQTPKRRLRVWAPEGYAGLDFVTKTLRIVQPSAELREKGLRVADMDLARKAALKDEIFGKHLQTLDLNCQRGDQLTSELRHFIQCVRTAQLPRVTGEDGRDALALAERILESVRTHNWNGEGDLSAIGMHGMPSPLGTLFDEV
ncbi:MAG: Gfo/Idh/MocA family oxidoreductase, partial [Planctomycetes bacterium]|nr:Gfo/Idh/MocA family oxidoreductase [Planctomycetota bacterium]